MNQGRGPSKSGGLEMPLHARLTQLRQGWSRIKHGPRALNHPRLLTSAGQDSGPGDEQLSLLAELVDYLDQMTDLLASLAEQNHKLSEWNRNLAELSTTDGLTGLANRRHFMQMLMQEMAKAQRRGGALSLLMIDVDHFKRANDLAGHQAGDQALQLLARWLRQGVREVDAVGRYGGEEFIVLLVDCTLPSAVMVAEKLRRKAMEESFKRSVPVLEGFTVSIGAATLQPGMTPRELIAAADRALYRAKSKGRNCVESTE